MAGERAGSNLQYKSGIFSVIHELSFGLGREILLAASVGRGRNMQKKNIKHLYSNSKNCSEKTAEETPEEKKEQYLLIETIRNIQTDYTPCKDPDC